MSDSTALPGNPISSSDQIDTTYLTDLLQKIGHPAAKVVAFSREQLSGSSFSGGQIQRFRLTLSDGASAPDSLILKQARRLPSQTLDPDFVRREIDCYQNNLFAGLVKLIVPKVYHAVCDACFGRANSWEYFIGSSGDGRLE